MLPVSIRWPHKKHLMLLGNVAHIMTPFADEDANTALNDDLKLAHAIIGNPSTLDEGVIVYEKDLSVRVTHVQRVAWEELLNMFEPAACRTL